VEPPFYVDSEEAARQLLLFEFSDAISNDIEGNFEMCGFGYPIDTFIEMYAQRATSLKGFAEAFTRQGKTQTE
jgi:hypothetical protein